MNRRKSTRSIFLPIACTAILAALALLATPRHQAPAAPQPAASQTQQQITTTESSASTVTTSSDSPRWIDLSTANVRALAAPRTPAAIQLCQALGPAAPCPIMGVDCAACGPYGYCDCAKH